MPFKINPFTNKPDFYEAGSGGTVVGPGSSTDNALVRWDGTTGALVQNGVAIETDAGEILAGAGSLTNAAYSKVGDANTGVYFPADNEVAMVANGTNIFHAKEFTGQVNKLMLFFAGMAVNYTSPGAYPYSVLDASDWIVLVDTSSARTINLPNSSTNGRVYVIKDAVGSAGTNNISVTTPGGVVTIDGSTTYTMNVNYGSLMVFFDGSNYLVI